MSIFNNRPNGSIKFYTAGKRRMTVANNGNVGIGTTTPSEKLHLNTPGGTNMKIFFSEGDLPAVSLFYEGSAGAGTDNLIHMRSEISGNEANIMTWKLNGNVGIGTTDPQADLHIRSADARIRLHDALTGQAWDIYTGGDPGDLEFEDRQFGTTPFIIQAKTGNIGMGTEDPEGSLDIDDAIKFQTDNLNTLNQSHRLYFDEADDNNNFGFSLIYAGDADPTFEGTTFTLPANKFFIVRHESSQTGTVALTIERNSGNVGIGTTDPDNPLEMGSGAHVTAGGVWTNASSRELKENISDLTFSNALSALEQLNPVTYNYKVDKQEAYVGFIAEDVPDIVATNDRKSLSPMDIVGVLTKVVQEQQKAISKLQDEVNALKQLIR